MESLKSQIQFEHVSTHSKGKETTTNKAQSNLPNCFLLNKILFLKENKLDAAFSVNIFKFTSRWIKNNKFNNRPPYEEY